MTRPAYGCAVKNKNKLKAKKETAQPLAAWFQNKPQAEQEPLGLWPRG